MVEIVLMVLAALLAAAGLVAFVRVAGAAFLRYRGKRIVTCPETGACVGVDVDALRAAVTTPLGGEPELRLKTCTRWPEREHCDQECLTQIEEAPRQCLVRTRLERWYAGTTCALCGAPLAILSWANHQPALLGPGHRPVALSEVAPEELPGVLATHERLCWNCYVAESFRFRYPDLVVEDPRSAERPQPPVS